MTTLKRHKIPIIKVLGFFNAGTVNAGKTLSYFKNISSDGGITHGLPTQPEIKMKRLQATKLILMSLIP